MKKLTLLLFISFLSTAVYTQGFDSEIFIGVNASQLDGDDYAGFNKPGLNIGAAVYYSLNDNLDLSAELAYTQKGSIEWFEDQVTGQRFKVFEIRMNYLEVPILLHYYLRNNFSLHGGFSASSLLNARVDDGTSLGFIERTEFFQGLVLNANAGFGYHFTPNFSSMARFQMDISQTAKFQYYRNYMVSLTVRYRFQGLERVDQKRGE